MRLQPKTTMDRYRASLEHVRTLDPAEELELARRWRDGDERAGHRLVEASLPFVISIAREYRRWGMPLEDLVQQGNLGLLKAAAKFDPTRECRLVTYAAYWIRAEIREYVVHGYRIVRLGTTRTERRAMRAYRRSALESPEHMAEVSGMPLKRARKLWPLLGNRDVSLDVRYDDRVGTGFTASGVISSASKSSTMAAAVCWSSSRCCRQRVSNNSRTLPTWSLATASVKRVPHELVLQLGFSTTDAIPARSSNARTSLTSGIPP
mgnify:CR=1 FL=1